MIIGIDNGTTGSICILSNDGIVLLHCCTPVKKELSYTKTKQYITRIDFTALRDVLKQHTSDCFYTGENRHVCIERPMVNPGRFKATISAIRALEATLIVLEDLALPYSYIDSKEWQHAMLPKGLWEGEEKADSKELKMAAVDVARRLFPSIHTKDADSLMIAEYTRRTRMSAVNIAKIAKTGRAKKK